MPALPHRLNAQRNPYDGDGFVVLSVSLLVFSFGCLFVCPFCLASDDALLLRIVAKHV